MDPLQLFQSYFFHRLHKAGIPTEPAKQTPDQQAQAAMELVAAGMEWGAVLTVTQEGVYNA